MRLSSRRVVGQWLRRRCRRFRWGWRLQPHLRGGLQPHAPEAAAPCTLASTPLQVAPPVVADFDLEGVPDVLLLTRTGYYGLRTSLGTGSLAVQVSTYVS